MKLIQTIGIFGGILIATTAYSAGSLVDQYKQMGSVAGLAEICYGSTKIPESLSRTVEKALEKNPEIAETMKALISEYDGAYKFSGINNKIWNGTLQSYSEPFTCTVAKDEQMIRALESKIIESLDNQ